jgi:small acid-soluble spore protein F (minor alpha/beta-type SASP)
MARRRNRSIMSDELKFELAKELGVADIVEREGFGGVTSRDCGNLVRLAIERAERSMAQGTFQK